MGSYGEYDRKFHALKRQRGIMDMDRKKIVFKESEEGEYTLLWVYRYLGGLISEGLINTKITANQLTYFSLILIFLASCCFFTGGYLFFLLGAVLIQFYHVIDCADGMLARIRGHESVFGDLLDTIAGHSREIIVFFCLCYALYRQTDDVTVWMLGFLVTGGSMFIRLLDGKVKSSAKEQKTVKDLKKKANIFVRQAFHITHTKYLLVLIGAVFNCMYFMLAVITLYIYAALAGIIYILGKKTLSLDRSA